ncbi:hypothetical protein ACKI14_02385 [Streptomyces turgidiscabies]|uniref:hypothetical protein n=1 Tax=Streptomyces turgidiscabies TaxID=85558 RepID=UPI0038F5FFCB
MSDLTREDIAEARKQGDVAALVLMAAGRTLKASKKPAAAGPDGPGYHIPRKGAWPCGTAASGPTPKPCDDCHDGAAP